MVIQQQNNLSTTTHNEHLHRLVITDEAVQRQQPVLAVQIGYQLNPGIIRKDRPNEDTVYVMQGKIPSDSPSTHRLRFYSCWWQMGWEDKGMGN